MHEILLLSFILTIISCGESADIVRLREENEKMRLEMERKKQETDSTLAEQSKKLEENQEKLSEQLKAAEDQKELEKLAEDEPQTMTNLVIRNETQQGTVLGTGSLFEAGKVRYIGWTADFTDNLVKIGKKGGYGKIYARYIRKDSYGDSWTTFENSGTFSKRGGSTVSYSRKYNMVYDGREHYTIGNRLGSVEGGGFSVGKWKLELFWENEGTSYAYYLGGNYFEIY